MRHVDALSYLPRTRVLELPKHSAVFLPIDIPESLFLVLSGRVRISRVSETGDQTLLRVVGPEQFFGTQALVPSALRPRQCALTMEPVQLMSWSSEEITHHVEQHPALALALCEYIGAANALINARVSDIIRFTTGPRVGIGLLQLAIANGKLQSDGAARLKGFTHQAFADYIGTSREIVTCEMNRLRRLGYITYSRRYTDVYPAALSEWMGSQGVPQRSTTPARAGSVAALR